MPMCISTGVKPGDLIAPAMLPSSGTIRPSVSRLDRECPHLISPRMKVPCRSYTARFIFLHSAIALSAQCQM